MVNGSGGLMPCEQSWNTGGLMPCSDYVPRDYMRQERRKTWYTHINPVIDSYELEKRKVAMSELLY